MPTVIIEDGSGVPGANSFIDRDYVTAYATARGRTEWISVSPSTLLDAAVIEAGDYLKNEARFVYRGTRMYYTQGMPFPRRSVTEYRGPSLPDGYISWRLKDAQAALAIRSFASPGSLQPDLVRGGAVKREKVDVLETEWYDKAPLEVTIREVNGLLAPLLVTDADTLADPYAVQSDGDNSPVFDTGRFNNTPEVGA